MNKKLVMWGTFLVFFLAGIVGSYKFINKDNQDMTIEQAAPTLPLVSMVIQSEAFNTLRGFTADMDVTDAARYVNPVDEDRQIKGQIETLGTDVQAVKYEVRNNDGSRLIEAGDIRWKEKAAGVLDFEMKFKDLIAAGEEYLLVLTLQTEAHNEINYYTRFVYGEQFDLDAQLDFVRQFHENSFDKEKISEISSFMEPDKTADNSTLAYVNIHSAPSQVTWGGLEVKNITEPEIYITYLQDNFGGYTLDYYAQSTVNDVTEVYHVVENFLVSTFGENIYLLDYERTADHIFDYEADVYQNDKIYLSIQSKEIPVTESDDGNMAAFVVNSSLYYYDDIENEINQVFSFFDGVEDDKRNRFLEHDIKVLGVNESGSIYYIVYGYMNRGEYEGKTGILLYSFNGQTKLNEEIGFYESTQSAAYVMQEVEKLAFLGREEKLYFMVDGNIVSYNFNKKESRVEVPYKEEQALFVSDDHSCVVVENDNGVYFWYLETGVVRQIVIETEGEIIPQGFISNDFVYGIFYPQDGVLQSDGTYARYMQEIRIQDAQGEVRKQYRVEDVLITECTIQGNQILLERMILENGTPKGISQDQIVASKPADKTYNKIAAALTGNYQTIQQVALKNKIDKNSLAHVESQEIFQEGHREILVKTDNKSTFYRVYNPWRVTEYTTDAGEAMQKADKLEGYARDLNGLIIWKKAATVTKNQIMAIEMEAASAERSSLNICLDIMLRQIGNPKDTGAELEQGKTCQEILANTQNDYVLMDITGASLTGMLYYTNQDIPIMVLYDTGEAILITGFNQFNIVVMDPVKKKLGYMSRSDAQEMLDETANQVFTYYRRAVN